MPSPTNSRFPKTAIDCARRIPTQGGETFSQRIPSNLQTWAPFTWFTVLMQRRSLNTVSALAVPFPGKPKPLGRRARTRIVGEPHLRPPPGLVSEEGPAQRGGLPVPPRDLLLHSIPPGDARAEAGYPKSPSRPPGCARALAVDGAPQREGSLPMCRAQRTQERRLAMPVIQRPHPSCGCQF